MSDQPSPSTQDVVICGGGLSGLLLARQLRREMPDLSVTLIDRMPRPLPDACHKVGESSVECGCQYLEELGLKDYLLKEQLVKLGLRFFPGGGAYVSSSAGDVSFRACNISSNAAGPNQPRRISQPRRVPRAACAPQP